MATEVGHLAPAEGTRRSTTPRTGGTARVADQRQHPCALTGRVGDAHRAGRAGSRTAVAAAIAASPRSSTTWLGCGGVSSRPKQPHEPIIVPLAQRGDDEDRESEVAGATHPPEHGSADGERGHPERPAPPPTPTRTSGGRDGRPSARRAPTVMVGSRTFCAPASAQQRGDERRDRSSAGTTRPPRRALRTGTGARAGCRRCRPPGGRW